LKFSAFLATRYKRKFLSLYKCIKKGQANMTNLVKKGSGPFTQKLEQILSQGGSVKITMEFLISTTKNKAEIDAHRAYSRTYWWSNGNGQWHYGKTKKLIDALNLLVNDFSAEQLDLLSVRVRSSNTGITGKEIKVLVIAVLCEFFGMAILSADDLKALKKKQQAEQKKIRNEILTMLREKGSQSFNTLSRRDKEKAKHFRKTDLTSCRYTDLDLSDLDFKSSIFDDADLSGAHFEGTDLKKSKFKGTRLENCHGENAKLQDCDFTNAYLRKIDLQHANLSRVVFANADLKNAILSYSTLCGADLSTAKLKGVKFEKAKYDNATIFPDDFIPPTEMNWKGKGPAPSIIMRRKARQSSGHMDLDIFMDELKSNIEPPRLKKALKMLKADSFKLFTQISETDLVGVVKSQTDSDLVYSCWLDSDGNFSCCTQNLNPCGGLRGKLCKHLLVLVLGLAKEGEIDLASINEWVDNTKDYRPELDKDRMGDVLLRYKGAEAGEVDWRPTETIPEDYYMY
jgi:hypothetical protein